MIPLRASAGAGFGAQVRALATTRVVLARGLPRNSAMRMRERALSREIADLEQQVSRAQKKEEVARATRDLPPLDDATLEAIYKDLIAPPPAEPRVALAPPPQRVVAQLAARLGPQKGSEVLAGGDDDARHTRREHILASISGSDALSLPDSHEWAALAAESAADGDIVHLQRVLSSMTDCGISPTLDVYARAMDACAARGALEPCLALADALTKSGLKADDRVKHALVKVHASNGLLFPAIQQLAHWEASVPAPQQSYAVAIDSILRHPVRSVHPVAWSLFQRMRFAAHPVPDPHTYALMMRACAAAVPQPTDVDRPGRKPAPIADAERALDMFREMTEYHGMEPTKEVYDSIILTCARRREHYGDARRIMRLFLENESASMQADVYTFNALLQGVARAGDITVARWALAEMLRSSLSGARGPNEETMTNIFWTYAVFDPPRTVRAYTKSKKEKQATATPPAEGLPAEAPSADPAMSEQGLVTPPTFTDTVPRTSEEVLYEARALMARILADQQSTPDESEIPTALQRPLAGVKPTARLLNAYLSVLTHHLPVAQRLAHVIHDVKDDDGVFALAGVEPNGHTIAFVLEVASGHPDRLLADRIAHDIWSRWESLEEVQDAKTISRVWALMIRNYAKSFNTEAGAAHLRRFFAKYPPRTRRAPHETAPAAVRRPRIDLAPAAPPSAILDALYRLPRVPQTAKAESTDQYPRLGFRDLELLHHRCVALRDVRALNLISLVDREYRM